MCALGKWSFSLNLGTAICRLVATLQMQRNEQRFNSRWLGEVEANGKSRGWSLYLLFGVLAHTSPAHLDGPVWETTAPAGTSSIYGFSTWNESRQQSSISATKAFANKPTIYNPRQFIRFFIQGGTYIYIYICSIYIWLHLKVKEDEYFDILSKTSKQHHVILWSSYLNPGQTLGTSQSVSSSSTSGHSCPPLDGCWMIRRFLDCFIFTALPA